MIRSTIALAASALMVAGCTTGAPSGTDSPAASHPPSAAPLSWTRCGDDHQECASLDVPLDYSDPTGPKVGLALVRVPARQPESRVGAIVLDFGGPGISGVDELLAASSRLSDAVEARYDIVSWDRRGVGRSSPLWCRTAEEMGDYARTLAAAQWSAPSDGPAVSAWAGQAQAFADGCAQQADGLVGHIGTRDSARDLDSIRAALGEPDLNYLGWSHGTKLGALYIDMYAQNVGRMVLDSAIDPSLSITDYNRGQSRALEAQLMRFVDYCTDSGGCPLPTGGEPAITALKNYVLSLPTETTEPRAPTRADAMAALSGAMYMPSVSFTPLLDALRKAFTGDGGDLIDLGGLRPDPDSGKPSNYYNALYAINCYDSTATPDLTETARLARQWNADTPFFGAPNAWAGLRCSKFPAHDPIGPRPVHGDGAPPVLVIGALRDGATPVEWSRALADQLASSRLVVADTDDHTVYPVHNMCVRRIVDEYFLDGSAPPANLDCPAD